jgi:hypothetical protein
MSRLLHYGRQLAYSRREKRGSLAPAMEETRYRYLVRLPMLMRDQLARSAEYHRRSINSEIVTRLQLSFSGLPGIAEQRALAPAMHEHIEHLLNRGLSSREEQLVRRFRSLSPHKQDALLDLLS